VGKRAAYGMLGRGGEGESPKGQESSRQPCWNERALDRLISKFVYENIRSLSSDEATCLGDRLELDWTQLAASRGGSWTIKR